MAPIVTSTRNPAPGHTAGVELTWLDEPTVDALRAALRTVAPDLAEATIVPRGLEPNDDPKYCTASAVVDGRFVVKFAWAGPAALRICYQAQILDARQAATLWLPLPEVTAVSRDPAMLVLRWVPATPFFEVRHRIGPAEQDGVARDLAMVLAGLHDPGVLRAVAEAVGPLPKPTAHATTDTLRARFGALARPDQRCGCDWSSTWRRWAPANPSSTCAASRGIAASSCSPRPWRTTRN